LLLVEHETSAAEQRAGDGMPEAEVLYVRGSFQVPDQTQTTNLKQISAGDGDANWKPNRRAGFHSHGLDNFNAMITYVTPSMLHLRRVPECKKDDAAAAAAAATT
jgi:hypothetical protein